MASSKTRSICLICLKRFGGGASSRDNGVSSYQCRLLIPHTGLDQGSCLSGTSTKLGDPLEASAEPAGSSVPTVDLYMKFLMVVKRYLKIPMADSLLMYAKDHKNSTGEDVPAFCDQCQTLVGYVCDLYAELHTLKLHLLSKVEELEQVTRSSTKKVSQKLARGLLKSITEQLNVKSIRQLELFRKTFILGCQKKVKGSTPLVQVHRGLFPEEWKYTYAATKQSLMHLITVFALATVTKPNPQPAKKILKTPHRKLKPSSKSDGRKVTFEDIGNHLYNRNKSIKLEHGAAIKRELAAGEDDGSGNENGHFGGYDGDAGFPDTGGDDNDSDWSGGAASPPGSPDSAESEAEEVPRRRRRLRMTRQRLSSGTAVGEPGNDSDKGSDDDDDRDPEFKSDVVRRKVRRPSKNSRRRKQPLSSKNATLPCKICKRMFMDRRGLAKHLWVVHNTHLEYFCEICGLKCVSQKDYAAHKQISHSGRSSAEGGRAGANLQCPKCNLKFIDTRGLSKHMLTRHRSRLEYTCAICGHKSNSAADHVKHRSKFHRKRPHVKRPVGQGIGRIRRQIERSCRECDLEFSTRTEYLSHCKDVHTMRRFRFECPVCMAQIANDQRFQRHLALHQDESAVLRVYHCEVCGKTYYEEDQLSAHFQEGHQGSYNCDQCDSRFGTSKLLRSHLEIHETETKNFFCNFCFRGYTNEQFWQIHRKVAHVGNERIFCDQDRCPEEFTNVHDLNEHLETHLDELNVTEVALVSTDQPDENQVNTTDTTSKTSDEIPDSCKTDGTDAAEDLNMTEEETDKTTDNKKDGRQIFKCSTCGWGFLNHYGLVLHELVHIPYEGDLGYRCPKEGCGKVLRLKEKLVSHYSYMHGKKYKQYVCHECNCKFSAFIWYKTHLRLHAERDSGRKFSCIECQHECVDSIQLNEHKRSHHSAQVRHVSIAAQMVENLPPKELGPDGKPLKRRGRPPGKERTEDELRKLKEKRENAEKVPCEVCNITCVTMHRLRKHLETMHELAVTDEEKKIQCNFCSIKFAHQQTHQLHCVSLHMQKYRFVCDADNCDTSEFESLLELNEHLRKVHLETSEASNTVVTDPGSAPSAIMEVEKVLTTGEETVMTVAVTTPKPVVKVESLSFCRLCGWGFVCPDIRDLHELVHTPSLSNNCYPCPGCEKTFPSTTRLTSHFNSEHGKQIRPWKCVECSARFTSKEGLKLHIYRHKSRLNAETLMCIDCGKEFKDGQKYRIHRLRHDPANHVICPEGCGEKFYDKTALHLHMRKKHGKGDRFPCPICGQTFIYNFEIKKHIEWVHGDAKYECDVCGRKYKRPNALKYHKRVHDPNAHPTPFVCSECGVQYKTEEGLKYHMGSMHTPKEMKRFGCPHCPYKSHRPMLFRMHLKVCLKNKGLPYDEEKWGKLPQTKAYTGPPRKPGRKPGWGRKKKKKVEEEELEEKTTTEEEDDEEEKEEKPTTSQDRQMPVLYPHQQPQLTPAQLSSSTSSTANVINTILSKLTGIPNLTPEVEPATVTRRGRRVKKPNKDFGIVGTTTGVATSMSSMTPSLPSTIDHSIFQTMTQQQGTLSMLPHPQLFGNNHGYQNWLNTTSAGVGNTVEYSSFPQQQSSSNESGYTPSPPPLQQPLHHHHQMPDLQHHSNMYSPNNVYSPTLPDQPQNLRFGARK